VGTNFDALGRSEDMTKAAIIISAILVFAGVAAAGSLPGLRGGSSDSPTLSTPGLATTTTGGTTTVGTTSVGTSTVGTTTTDEPGEDISGPCDEAEHANDPRCTGAAPQAGDDRGGDDGDRRERRERDEQDDAAASGHGQRR
jgi:hypothetical protein